MVKRDCRLGERCGPVEPRDRRRALRPRAAEALPDPLPVRAYFEIYKTISLNFQIWEEVQRQNYSGSFSRLITTSASISAGVASLIQVEVGGRGNEYVTRSVPRRHMRSLIRIFH